MSTLRRLANARPGPILFAYDGSEHAKAAIREAGHELRNDRRAIVLTVWQLGAAAPLAAGPAVPSVDIDDKLEREARRVANEGARLARASGFDAAPSVEQGDPVWQRIVQSAEERGARIVVMGSHARTGMRLVLLGGVVDEPSHAA